MSDIFVKNTGNVQLPRCVFAANGRGFADLAPGQVGKLALDPSAACLKVWREKGRLVEISAEEFQAVRAPVQPVTPKAASLSKLEDGSTAVVQSTDAIPEAPALPDARVVNLEKQGVAIVAPSTDTLEIPPAPVIAEQPAPEDFRPRTLTGSGEEIAPQAAAVAVAPVESSTPEEVSPSTEAAVQPTASTVTPEEQIQAIVKLSAWRQQEKALKNVTDPAILRGVAETTKFSVIAKQCQDRLAK